MGCFLLGANEGDIGGGRSEDKGNNEFFFQSQSERSFFLEMINTERSRFDHGRSNIFYDNFS